MTADSQDCEQARYSSLRPQIVAKKVDNQDVETSLWGQAVRNIIYEKGPLMKTGDGLGAHLRLRQYFDNHAVDSTII